MVFISKDEILFDFFILLLKTDFCACDQVWSVTYRLSITIDRRIEGERERDKERGNIRYKKYTLSY